MRGEQAEQQEGRGHAERPEAGAARPPDYGERAGEDVAEGPVRPDGRGGVFDERFMVS